MCEKIAAKPRIGAVPTEQRASAGRTAPTVLAAASVAADPLAGAAGEVFTRRNWRQHGDLGGNSRVN